MAMSLDMTFLHSLNPLSKSCLASGRTVSPKQKYPFSGFSKVIFQSALSLYDDPVPPVGLWYNMYVRKPAVVVINTRLTDIKNSFISGSTSYFWKSLLPRFLNVSCTHYGMERHDCTPAPDQFFTFYWTTSFYIYLV